MRVASMPQPAATLTVTREPDAQTPPPAEPLRAPSGGVYADLASRRPAPEGLAPQPIVAPMVSRWVTLDYACPSGVVGTRIAIAATEDEPEMLSRVGTWEVHDDGSLYAVDLTTGTIVGLPLGVVVGSAIVEASYPIVSHLGTADHDCPFPCIAVTESRDYLYVMRGRNGHQDITDISGQLPFADWSPGRFAWHLTDAKPLPEPVPWVSSGGRLPEWQP